MSIYDKAHKFSANHYQQLKEKQRCGRFYCRTIFSTDEIQEWIPDPEDGTAICPCCGIDAVLGESSGYPITPEFLKKMNKYSFG